MDPAPNWYTDPQDPSRLRWWDGGAWTDRTKPQNTSAENLETASRDGSKWKIIGAVAAVVAAVVLISSVVNLSDLTGFGQDPADSAQVYVEQEGESASEAVNEQPAGKTVLAVTEVSPEETPYTVLEMWDAAIDGDVYAHMRKVLSLPEIAPIVPTNAKIKSALFSHEVMPTRGDIATVWTYSFHLPGTVDIEGEDYAKSLTTTGLGSPTYANAAEDGGHLAYVYESSCEGVGCTGGVEWTVDVIDTGLTDDDGRELVSVEVKGTYIGMTKAPDFKRAVPGLAWLANLNIPETENVTGVGVYMGLYGDDVTLITTLMIERPAQDYEQAKADLLDGKTFLGMAMQPADVGDGWEAFRRSGSDGLLRGVNVEVTMYERYERDVFETVYEFSIGRSASGW